MTFSSFENESSTSSSNIFKKNSQFGRKSIAVVIVVLAVGVAVGILIGHYGIKKDNGGGVADGVFLAGVPEAINREANETVTDWILKELNPNNIRENLRKLVAKPHIAGTDMDKIQAEELRQFWLNEGLDKAVTTPYDILLSYPDDVIPNKVRILSSAADPSNVVVESPDNEEDLTPEEWSDDFPFPNLAYSGSGTVRGDIVYVNHGRLVDYEMVEELGINISGKIVLARFGRSWRAEKVRLAEKRGAVGVILYSDPADYTPPWATDVYNKSIWMPPGAVQRGGVFMGDSDPLTPGYPAIKSAYRYDESEVDLLSRIPAMPIGYGTAREILDLLDGDTVPDGWSGNLLDRNYTLGPGFTYTSYIAELSVHNTNQRQTAYNAFGMIKGETEPDRYVMLGNHRDSWVLGAVDPSSGTATMMELSRVLGNLVKKGWWRPRRSIIFCSWGAEEFGLIGSIEWIEENSKVLDFRSVAYINMDIAVTGNYSLRGLGSPPVFSAMYKAAKKVPYPDAKVPKYSTVYDAWLERRPLIEPNTSANLNVPRITTPGGGSDYGGFQMRAGIPCADFRYEQDYAGEKVLFYPLYHTSYETFYAVDTLIDPGFMWHATIGKLSGELLRDLADSKILPFNVSDYARFLEHYTTNLKSYNSTLLEHYHINITELNDVIDQYKTEAANFNEAASKINTNNPFEVRRINDQMMQIDRAFLDPASLPDRTSMYRHLVHSTISTTGIAGVTFPGLEDALYKLGRAPDDPDLIRELQHHYSVLVFTVQSAAYSLKETTDFFRDKM